MRRWLPRLGVTLVTATMLTWSADAAALKPSRHKKISIASCRDAGLPRDFCRRVGREAYDTDAHEWEDMSAHAQPERGEPACDAARHAVDRMDRLGLELRAAVDKLAVKAERKSAVAVATALGRAVHTIQDNCAHQGMPNAQHAWYTLADFCDQSHDDPDLDHAAYRCAERETDAVMSAVAELIDIAHVESALGRYSCEPEDSYGDRNEKDPCMMGVLPAPWQACSFLGSAEDWDGVDHRWNSAVVGSALFAAFSAGLFAAEPPADLCGGDPSALARPTPNAPVDTADGPRSCGLAHAICFGKVDSADSLFADDDDALLPPPPPAAACSVGEIPLPSERTPWLWALVVAAVLAVRRRLRRECE